MARTNLANTLICKAPRIWYLAVAGEETVQGAMTNLQDLQTRLRNDHLKGAIVDFRRLTGTTQDENWPKFVRGLEMNVPNGMPMAWIAGPRSTHAANILILATQRAGAHSQLCLNFAAAGAAVGLPLTVPDPLRELLKTEGDALSPPPVPKPPEPEPDDEDPEDTLFLS